MQDFRELLAWKKAHLLVLHVHQAAASLPSSENFGLLLQLRRSATNIASKIAEGAGRSSKAEFAGDLNRARAAAHELEYLLLLSHDLGYLADDVHASLTEEVIEVRRISSGLLNAINSAP